MNRLAISISVFVQLFAYSAHPVLAAASDEILGGLNATNSVAGYNAGLSLPALVGRLISAVLGIIGIIFVINIIISGINYMTAGGDDKKVASAKQNIVQSVVGMVLIVGAYALSSFVIGQLIAATVSTPAP